MIPSLSVGPEMLTVGMPLLLFAMSVVNVVVDAVDVAVDVTVDVVVDVLVIAIGAPLTCCVTVASVVGGGVGVGVSSDVPFDAFSVGVAGFGGCCLYTTSFGSDVDEDASAPC